MTGNKESIGNIIAFIKELELLKDVTRTAWTREGRQESVAEHSWRLALFAFALEEYFPDIDMNKAIRMSLIHDLGEAYGGDISATIEVNEKDKLKREEEALQQLLTPLLQSMRDKFLELWQEYNECQTKEARLVKAIDKMETIIQHNQGRNPADFDYGFNLDYGKKFSLYEPVLQSLREMIDGETIININKR
ncbi:HD domain-containing protein [Paenibacillus radicis (ex Xue et al. 2023)]|uniref:5'-deoxynucleotidase n=1 Tax=Paenibacillus radicis (ex Xue et al. 2023) TaxID=2972489 RepID=A0ABT1YC83_9BACL|nr:HD domain-containing protein [Paenibacillus radicis (ex Xue et al. 2023)]MCR8630365.1 HD domain-containing protein [Paenibacillus radicis (ex Xue et al. 2023)]